MKALKIAVAAVALAALAPMAQAATPGDTLVIAKQIDDIISLDPAEAYELSGIEVVTMGADERARLRNQQIGFIFQNFNLLSRTSALENVELPLMYNPDFPRRERRTRAAELLEQVGLANRHDHKPNQLSGGQQQRVAIARALVNHPSILMCDEPTGNLDTRTSEEIMQLFRQLNESRGLTVILVTHDQDVASQAKRALVLVDGEIVRDTTNFEEAAEALHARTRMGAGH